MVSAEIPQCSRHICELLFLIFVLGLNLLLLLNDWPLWLKRMGQRRNRPPVAAKLAPSVTERPAVPQPERSARLLDTLVQGADTVQ